VIAYLKHLVAELRSVGRMIMVIAHQFHVLTRFIEKTVVVLQINLTKDV
jgi:hypothetical protein